MMSHHASELEFGTNDSVASSPRSDHPLNTLHDQHTRVRFMCSFGGKIFPRPHDNQLRYVGGETRIVAVQRCSNFSTLLIKLSKLSGTTNINIKYQLPNEDLDALISVTTDDDVENMMEEYDRLAHNQNPRLARLRLFLFPKGDVSRTSSISSLLDGSASRDHWFLDAINGSTALSSRLERNQSEASSIVSELPDYLFGLDNSDETQTRDSKLKTQHILAESISNLDQGSLASATSSLYFSASSTPCVPPIPNLPPVKTKSNNSDLAEENQIEGFTETVEPPISQPTGYSANEMPHYIMDSRYPGHAVQPMHVYYVPGPIPPGNVLAQPISIQAPYFQQYSTVPGQVPPGYHHQVSHVGQVYGGGMRPVTTTFEPYDVPERMFPDGGHQ